MNRNTLLGLAAQCPLAHQPDLALAATMSSDGHVRALTERLRTQLHRARESAQRRLMLMRCAGWAAFGLAMAEGVMQNQSTIPAYFTLQTTEVLCFTGVVLLTTLAIASWLSGSDATFKADHNESLLKALSPVPDTQDGRAALDLVNTGTPLALAWQAQARSERGALAFFDIEVLRCLDVVARRPRISSLHLSAVAAPSSADTRFSQP